MTHRLTLAAWAVIAAPVFADNPITYDQQVVAVLREKCWNCHNADKARGGLDVSSYAKLMEGGSSGAVIKPGDADSSRFYRLTAHLEQPVMPPNSSPIAQASIDLIKDWIDRGAPENAGSKVKLSAKPKLNLAVKPGAGKPEGPPPMPEAALPQDVVRTPRPDAITALAASPWAPLIAVGANRQILIYHAGSLEFLGKLPFAPGRPEVLKFSRNGAILLAGGGRAGQLGRAVAYEVKTGQILFEVGDEADTVLAADLSPDQSEVALGGPGKLVRVYATADGSKLREMKKHTDWVTAIEYSPDGVLLASGDRAGNLILWETDTGREFHNLRGHKAAITDLSWRPDSNLLASSSDDASIRLWEPENGTAVKTWDAHGGGARSVKYAADGRLVTTGRDRVTKLWDGNGGQQRAFEALPDLGLRAAIDPEVQRVFAGDLSGQLAVWQAADGKRIGTLTTNPRPIRERLELAKAEYDRHQAAYAAAAREVESARGELAKRTGERDAVRQALAEAEATEKGMAGAVGPAEEAVRKANERHAELRRELAAWEVTAAALTEAAEKVKAAAAATPDNPALAAAAEKTRRSAEQEAAEREAVRGRAAEAEAMAKSANEKLAAARKAVADAAAAVKAARDAIPAQETAVQTAVEAVKSAEAKLSALAPARDAAKAELDKLAAVMPPAA